ncbi:MAG: hypothetical protein F6J96_23440 [Symploca sp. SIO1C2]|nr:hypothetical protein [Symploca sp. SIO1C2]
MALSAGDKLYGDKYTIEKELGRGRFSITYRVNDHSDNRFVIKTLDDLLINSLNPSEQDRLETKFFQEALKLTSCNHPNIVKVRDSFQQGSKKEWLDALGIIIDKEHFPEGHSSPVLQRSLDKKIKLWTLVAALITAVGVMLSGIGELSGWFQPDSSPSPSASPTNTQ